MTTIYHPTHPHYLVHKAYVEGCFADPDNPPVVQVFHELGVWLDTLYSNWSEDVPHRIKPRTITRTVTYPEPMRVAPEKGTTFSTVSSQYISLYRNHWNGMDCDSRALKNGMCFANADAQACYDALFGGEK